MKTRRAWLALGLASAVVVVPRGATGGLTLAVQGRANSNVSLAAQGPFVVAVWAATSPGGGAADVVAAASRDGGATFQSPVRVNDIPGDARVNGEQPPRVTVARAVGDAPVVTVVWTSKRPEGTVILSARSTDGGRTFAKAAPIPGGLAAGNRGWEAVTVDAAGRTRVVWLDHREMAGGGGGEGHHHAGHEPSPAAARDGAAAAERSKLYVSTIGDATSAAVVTGGVCYCCKTAAVAAPDETMYVAWRHVYPGNLRDIAFSMSRDGGRVFSPPVRVSDDRWQLEGCPDDGPAMARTRDGRIHIVWPTLVSDANGRPTIGLFQASTIDGVTFTPRLRVPTEGVPHHPQIAATADGRVALAWDEVVAGKRRVALASATPTANGGLAFAREVPSDSEAGFYPFVATTPSSTLVAWTSGAPEDSVIRLERRANAR